MVGQLVKHRPVDGLAHRDLAQRACGLERHVGTVAGQHNRHGAQDLAAIQPCQRAGALDPVILAELLIDHEIAHRLTEHHVGDFGQKRALLGRQIGGVDMVDVIGRTGIAQFCRSQPIGHGGKMHRAPVPVEIFMGQIMPVLVLDLLDAIGDLGIGAGVERIGLDQLFGKPDGVIDARENALPVAADHPGMLGHQMAHGGKCRPAWQRVVADVEDTADFQLAADEIDDDGAVLVRDPAPDAMQADVIKIRQIGARAEFCKSLVIKARSRAYGLGQLLRKARLRWIEIRPVPLRDAGGGMNVGAQSLSKPQLARRPHIRANKTRIGEGQLHPKRV